MTKLSPMSPAAQIDPIVALDITRVAELAAISAAHFRGLGNEIDADRAAARSVQRELSNLPIDGTIVIGEGTRDQTLMLFVGERVGSRFGLAADVAVDPLEGATACAKCLSGAITVIAMANSGTLLHVPDVQMEKIAVGPGYPRGVVDLDAPIEDNLSALAKAKGVRPSELTVMMLDRPRHSKLVTAARSVGASVRLIADGDIAGVVDTADPDATGVDMYVGIGNAPQGILAATALRCVGGQMQTRLVPHLSKEARPEKGRGVLSRARKYNIEDMVSGECLFVATGVTNSDLLKGVRFHKDTIETETLVMRSSTGSLRRIRAYHQRGGTSDASGTCLGGSTATTLSSLRMEH